MYPLIKNFNKFPEIERLKFYLIVFSSHCFVFQLSVQGYAEFLTIFMLTSNVVHRNVVVSVRVSCQVSGMDVNDLKQFVCRMKGTSIKGHRKPAHQTTLPKASQPYASQQLNMLFSLSKQTPYLIQLQICSS